ncbi:hypothetical protein [Streptomyces sp. NPDC050145]|uniref:hypothetical protein n=1 Tax=Streptomyces sp. NPDC050145 TaxID=3365602 RepID=UPI0037A8EC24
MEFTRKITPIMGALALALTLGFTAHTATVGERSAQAEIATPNDDNWGTPQPGPSPKA